MRDILTTKNLVKNYSGLKAVNGVSFAIEKGTCFGLLGPNGAGKTTTVEMLEGIIKPTSGEILYEGEPLGPHFRERAGIMFQTTALPDFITTQEMLELFANLYTKAASINELIKACSLEEFLDRDAKHISGGQRQRLLLAISLINDPDIVFLDEPTTGLDPQARRRFWQLIRDIRARGKTIVLTTHYMDEAYELCNEIIIMDHGKIIAEGTPNNLLSRHYNDVVVQFPEDDLPKDFQGSGMDIFRSNGTAEIITGDVDATVKALMLKNVSMENMQIRKRTLEDLFIELTGKELRE